MTTVAIMQPSYMPWIGYLDLIDRADAFVFLDDIIYSHRSWQQRNRIKTPDGLGWITVPVRHTRHNEHPINEVMIAEPQFWQKHLRTITANYARAPHYQFFNEKLCEIFEDNRPPNSLATINITIIRKFAEWAELSSRFALSSEFAITQTKTERLVALCKALDADTYISPLGSITYLAESSDKFEAEGLNLRFQNFLHPEYAQRFPPFAAYASALDLFMNEGPDAARIIRQGRKDDLSVEGARQLQQAQESGTAFDPEPE